MMNMTPGQGQRGETTFFNEHDFFVSNARIVVKSTTYPLGHVTSVTPFTIPPDRNGPILGVIIGGFMTIGAFASTVYKTALLGLPIVIWGVLALRRRKAKHGVHITTSAGRVELLLTEDFQFAQRLSVALSQAMIARG